MTATLKEVVAFLTGEAPLDGVWFGGVHPTERGAFWWRKHLRQALPEAEQPTDHPRPSLSDPLHVAAKLDAVSDTYVNKWDLPMCNLLREAAWHIRDQVARNALQSNVDPSTIRSLNPLESQHHEEGTPHR